MAGLLVVRCTMSIRSARFVVAAAATHGQGAVQPLVWATASSQQLFPHQQLRRSSFACSDSQISSDTKQNHCHWSSALAAAGAFAGSVGAAQCAPGPGPGEEYWCIVCGEPHEREVAKNSQGGCFGGSSLCAGLPD